jgi:uncharacterized protein (TIGR02271 family)
MLVELKDGGYFFPLSFAELEQQQSPRTMRTQTPAATAQSFSANTTSSQQQTVMTESDMARTTTADVASANDSGVMATDAASPVATNMHDVLVVPVLEEELHVDKRRVETGRVRLTKQVHERQETVDVPLATEEIHVERVPVNRAIETAPPVRYEGDTMIVPLLEEVIIVEKRLMLREEVRITKRQSETRRPQQVMLRREEALVERINAEE